jgi:predicted 3-demethylubiquinone-9 3-methyltransferase (glyoxalase superfamily)
MQKITPFLWYDGQAEEAVKLYTSLFRNSKINSIKYWGEGSPFPTNQVMTASFDLDGITFYAFDAGPEFKFSEAISMLVTCKDQAEVDHFWNGFLENGGTESQCGWLKDKFGVSWQITPEILMKGMANPDKEKAGRVMQAMMKMKKIIVADIEKALE